jgi:hypothetical protein
MKKLFLASLFCLAFAAMLRAQEPVQPPNVGVRHFVIQNFENWQKHPAVASSVIRIGPKLTVSPVQSGVCSVPLLEVPARAIDPGITHKSGPVIHGDTIPESHLPAPACPKP